jgi:membrane protein DedA with SNARE-associated domain
VFITVAGLLLEGDGGAVIYWLAGLGDPSFSGWGDTFPGSIEVLTISGKDLEKRTVLAVTLVRLTPGLMQLPALATGSLHLSYAKFAAGVAISSLIYDSLIVLFGYIFSLVLSNAPQNIRDFAIVGLIILIVIAWVIVYFKYRRSFHINFATKNR